MDDRPGKSVNGWQIVGWLITLLALFFVGRWLAQLDQAVWSSLLHVNKTWLIGSLLILQLWFLMRFAAWEVIVRRHGSEAQRHQTLRTWTLSELARYVPGNVWSFAAKYRSSVSGGATKTGAVQALVIEALAQVAGALMTAALFYNSAQYWWVAMLVVIAFPTLMPVILSLVAKWKKWQEAPRVGMTESLGLLLWYSLLWIVFGVATAMIYRSFPEAPRVDMMWLIGANVAAWLIGYISIVTPMGLGVREVAFVRLTTDVVPSAFASLVSLVTRVWFVVSELLFLGLVIIWSMRKDKLSDALGIDKG